MGVFADSDVTSVFHYSPLHYLPFICRSQKLLSKPELEKAGFAPTHFRSTSSRQDVERGFGNYIHFALDARPPILKAKLAAGFPHFELEIPAGSVEDAGFHLCRFNIAKTRYFRGAKQQPPESPENGRYYQDLALPIAATDEEIEKLFEANFGKRMIEVLVLDRLDLPTQTVIKVFHEDDAVLAKEVIAATGVKWSLSVDGSGSRYPRNARYAKAVSVFIAEALRDTQWAGNGLEFDRV